MQCGDLVYQVSFGPLAEVWLKSSWALVLVVGVSIGDTTFTRQLSRVTMTCPTKAMPSRRSTYLMGGPMVRAPLQEFALILGMGYLALYRCWESY